MVNAGNGERLSVVSKRTDSVSQLQIGRRNQFDRSRGDDVSLKLFSVPCSQMATDRSTTTPPPLHAIVIRSRHPRCI
jgi:hypothetical protein